MTVTTLLCCLKAFLEGEVLQLKRTNDSTRTSRHSAGTVAANELLCQLQAEVLHREERLRRVRMKVFVENVCICDGHIEEKVEYVLIKLSAFSSAEIVASELVSSISPTHVLVVMDDVVGAGHRHFCSIFLSPKDNT